MFSPKNSTVAGSLFFSYNKRGVEVANEPPSYETVDREKFKKVVPRVEVGDLAATIKFLRKDKRLKNAKIVLLGWSEGTIIASMVAENKDNKVAALFLAGYVHESMADVIKWQYSGEWVDDLKKRFAENGKANLRAWVFKEHNHNLNFLYWALRKEMPEGIKNIFEVATSLNE